MQFYLHVHIFYWKRQFFGKPFYHLSFHLSFYPSIYLSIFLFICLYFFLSIYLFIHLFILLSICISFSLSVYPSIYLYIFLSICLSIFLSICWSICTSFIFLSIFYLSVSILLSIYLSCLTLSISVLAYWYSLLLLENIMRAISQSQSTESSYAFFITPNLRLLKVTYKQIDNSCSVYNWQFLLTIWLIKRIKLLENFLNLCLTHQH